MSVDDYGTGYSSLIYLKVLPVSELQIDGEFINGLTRNRSDASIVQSATDLGHNLGLTVVAEGVEDLATLTALEASGVDVAQGFHVGRPMPEGLNLRASACMVTRAALSHQWAWFTRGRHWRRPRGAVRSCSLCR